MSLPSLFRSTLFPFCPSRSSSSPSLCLYLVHPFPAPNNTSPSSPPSFPFTSLSPAFQPLSYYVSALFCQSFFSPWPLVPLSPAVGQRSVSANDSLRWKRTSTTFYQSGKTMGFSSQTTAPTFALPRTAATAQTRSRYGLSGLGCGVHRPSPHPVHRNASRDYTPCTLQRLP